MKDFNLLKHKKIRGKRKCFCYAIMRYVENHTSSNLNKIPYGVNHMCHLDYTMVGCNGGVQ